MTWNYRLVRRDDFLFIHEAYYTGEDATTIADRPVYVSGDSPAEILRTLEKMRKAIQLPILEYAEFDMDSKKLPPARFIGKAILNPPPPSKRLRQAAKRYTKKIGK